MEDLIKQVADSLRSAWNYRDDIVREWERTPGHKLVDQYLTDEEFQRLCQTRDWRYEDFKSVKRMEIGTMMGRFDYLILGKPKEQGMPNPIEIDS